MCFIEYNQHEKTDSNRLTVKPTGTKLADVPGKSRYNLKQTEGGKVNTKLPPLSGFFYACENSRRL